MRTSDPPACMSAHTLQPSCVHLYNASKLAETEDLAARDVAYVHAPVKRQHVMLALREKLYVLTCVGVRVRERETEQMHSERV